MAVSVANGTHSPPTGLEIGDQRPFAAGDESAGAGLQQRVGDADGGARVGLFAQRRHDLQDGGAGKRWRRRARLVESVAHCPLWNRARQVLPMPLLSVISLLHSLAACGETSPERIDARTSDHANRMSECCLKSIAGWNRGRRTPDRGACSGPAHAPGMFWLGGFKSDMKGTKAVALDDWAASARPRHHPLRLFRPRRIRRRIRRRHDRPLAGGQPRGVRGLLPRPAGGGRLLDGRLARAAAGARARAARGRARPRSPAWC